LVNFATPDRQDLLRNPGWTAIPQWTPVPMRPTICSIARWLHDQLMKKHSLLVLPLILLWSATAAAADYPAPQSPAIPDGTGYVEIPGAQVAINPAHAYKTIIDGQSAAAKPTGLLPALSRASLLLNALAVAHVGKANQKIVVIFHGPAVDGLLKNDGYRAKFGVDNPNLKVVKEISDAGAVLYVCGQYMAGRKLGIEELTPQIKLATAASLVLITYQNDGYAVLTDK
jgi:intracellular sulfur oxidation DsrE/DsrF family protein